MITPKAVSQYMRDMQRRSAESRWGGLSPSERSAAMKRLRSKAKRKPKTKAGNVEFRNGGTGGVDFK